MSEETKKMKELADYQGEDKVVTLEERRAGLKEEGCSAWTVLTKIATLDWAVDGFRPGNLAVISAPTAQGKTTMCQTITRNIAQQGVTSLWFPFEGDINDFLERLSAVTIESTVPAHLKSSCLPWIKERTTEAIAKYGVRVVFIDHLHYLLSMQSMNNSSLVIGGIVRQLKLMAQELNVVIFLICHIRKLQTTNKDGGFRRPSIEDLRDSSLIGQEADYVLLMWRKQDAALSTEEDPVWTNEAKLSLQKNRRTGRLCNVDLMMKAGFFEEKERRKDESAATDTL